MSAHLVADTLSEYGATTRVALADYLGPRRPQRHLYGLVADYPRRGGRMFRPSLCIASARVFGAAIDDAVRSAAAVELLHNAFLVHDDVEDESEQRRGVPTLNASYGAAVAVNVGDALAMLGLRAIIDDRLRFGPVLTILVLRETERMASESIEGQAIELGWRRDNATALTDGDYLGMVLKKTWWYTRIYPTRLGALIATRDERHLDRFVRFGFFLGAAFQIQDDILNLVGDGARYGKELDGDLLEGKRTLILIHLLRQMDAIERARLTEFLGLRRAERTRADVCWVRERIDAYGSLEHARQVAHAFAGAARHECTALFGGFPESRDKRFIEALPQWVIERS